MSDFNWDYKLDTMMQLQPGWQTKPLVEIIISSTAEFNSKPLQIYDSFQSLDMNTVAVLKCVTLSDVRLLDVQHTLPFNHPQVRYISASSVVLAPIRCLKTAKSLLTKPIKTSLWVCPPFQMYVPLWWLKLPCRKCVYHQKFSSNISLGGLPLSWEEQWNLPFDGAADCQVQALLCPRIVSIWGLVRDTLYYVYERIWRTYTHMHNLFYNHFWSYWSIVLKSCCLNG